MFYYFTCNLDLLPKTSWSMTYSARRIDERENERTSTGEVWPTVALRSLSSLIRWHRGVRASCWNRPCRFVCEVHTGRAVGANAGEEVMNGSTYSWYVFPLTDSWRLACEASSPRTDITWGHGHLYCKGFLVMLHTGPTHQIRIGIV